MKRMTSLLTMLCLVLLIGSAGAGEAFKKIDSMPELIKTVTPEYPEAAMKAGLEGDVIIEAYVDKTGKVAEAKATKCTNPNQGFEAAAVAAALKGVYKPATQKGTPVGVWVSFKVSFKLDDKKKG